MNAKKNPSRLEKLNLKKKTSPTVRPFSVRLKFYISIHRWPSYGGVTCVSHSARRRPTKLRKATLCALNVPMTTCF